MWLEDAIQVLGLELFGDGLITKANSLALFVVLCQNGLDVLPHGLSNILNFLPIPKFGTIVEDNRGLSSAEALEFVYVRINVLDDVLEDMAKATRPSLLLDLHEFVIHEDKRVVLDVF